MSEEATLLRSIHDELQKQSPEIVGRLELTEESLTAYDGQLLLRGVVHKDPGSHPALAHCHVIARIGRTSLSDPLDACISGIDSDRQQSLLKAGKNWVAHVGCIIFSLLQAKPVMGAQHFDGHDPWGVADCHGFVSPAYGFGTGQFDQIQALFETGLFEHAAAMAPAGVVHLAKVVLEGRGRNGWTRTLEIDGHAAIYRDDCWDCGVPAPDGGIIGQFAIFHYADQPRVIETRKQTDDAIRRFIVEFGKLGNVPAAVNALLAKGGEPKLARQAEIFVPLALGRVFLVQLDIAPSPYFITLKKDGSAGPRQKLMNEALYARSIALSRELFTGENAKAAKDLALTSSSVQAVNNALLKGSKPENLQFSPVVIREIDENVDATKAGKKASEKGVDTSLAGGAAMEARPKASKPWWRFW